MVQATSATAFQIQDSTGSATLFTADTINSAVTVNGSLSGQILGATSDLTNLVTNPSIEASLTTWNTNVAPFIYTTSNAWTASGNQSGEYQVNSVSAGYVYTNTGTGGFPVAAGTTYTAQGVLNISSALSNGVEAQITWYDSGGSPISSSIGTAQTGTGIKYLSVTAAAPVGAVYASVALGSITPGSAATVHFYWDAVSLIASSNTVPYFDGSSTGSFWNGTVNASTSTRASVAGSSALFKNNANSTSAFQIQNASSQSLVNVDSSNAIVTLGNGGSTAGDLVAWKTNAASLPTGIQNAVTVTNNGYVYVIGGGTSGSTGSNCSNSTPTGATYYTKLNADGSAGTWNTTTPLTSLPGSPVRCGASGTAYNGYVYVVGGTDSTATTDTNTVYYAKFNSDGTLGSWSTGTVLPSVMEGGSTTAYNGYIYEVDGEHSGWNGGGNGTIYYATLNPSTGAVGAWSSATAGQNQLWGNAIAYNGYLYQIAGYSSSTSIKVTSLNPSTGAIGTWDTQYNLPTTLYSMTSVVSNGYLYVMGGSTPSYLDNSTNAVYYAKINSDGTLGGWITSSSPMPTGQLFAGAVVSNGYIYQIGGESNGFGGGATTRSTVYYTTAQTPVSLSVTNTLTVGTVSVGNGSFMSKSDSTTSANTPRGITAADFNNDGRNDMATANNAATTTNGVSVYTNSATGLPLTPSSALTASTNPMNVTTGDFNGDGLPDLAAANNGTTTVSVYINNGSGLPTTATYTLTAGTNPWGLTTGDFNGDGRTDLAVANSGSTGTNAVSVFYNSGVTINVAATNSAGGSGPHGLTTGDFNADGKTDLAVANTTSGTVSIYINSGTAIPTAAPSGANLLTAANSPWGVVAADFNGDTKTDLAVTRSAAAAVAVFTNGGTALPTTASYTINTGTTPTGIVSADFNGDGKADAAVSNSGSTTASIYVNSGIVLPTSATSSVTTGTAPYNLVAADFNGDAKPDLGIVNATSNTASVILNSSLGASRVSITATDSTQAGLTVQGSTIIQSANNSTSAFQVQDSSGSNMFNIDTVTNRITVGAPASTPTILVLGAKSTSGDPTCVNGGMYYNSASNQAKVCLNGSWAALGVPTVTSLPGSPADGDEVYYQFNRGDGTNAYWHLVYNASTTWWDFIGGPSINPGQVTTDQSTASTTYTAAGFTALSTTLPLQGDYDIDIGARYFNGTGGAYGYMSLSFNGSTPADADGVTNSGGGSIGDVSSHTIRKTGLGANSVAAQYKVSGGTGFFSNRWMQITPIRVK